MGKVNIFNKSEGNFPAVGNTNISETDIPTAYGNYINSAGFLDTKGVRRKILNSYASAQLFKQGSRSYGKNYLRSLKVNEPI